MAEVDTKALEAAAASVFEPFQRLASFNGDGGEAFMSAARAYWEAVGAVNGELADFVTKRLEHDADLGRSLTDCDSWETMARLQQDWARTAMAEYASEAASLMQLCSRANLACWQMVQGPSAREVTSAGSTAAGSAQD